MKCHQILTGAANKGDRTFGVGSVEGIAFTVNYRENINVLNNVCHLIIIRLQFFQAYAAGCNIVILSSNFDRVQIIPGVCHSDLQIRLV